MDGNREPGDDNYLPDVLPEPCELDDEVIDPLKPHEEEGVDPVPSFTRTTLPDFYSLHRSTPTHFR